MTYQLFSATWILHCATHINQNTAYRQAAQRWHWPLVLELTHSTQPTARVYLDLRHGTCHEARPGTAQDCVQVPFVLSADVNGWQAVLSGDVAPLTALVRRQLRLSKGSMTTLAMHVAAANALVAAVADVATAYPHDTAQHHDAPTSTISKDPTQHTTFVTTSARGLQNDTPPMRLWRKAKKYGIWDPEALDYSQDRQDWLQLSDLERDVLLRLTGMFVAGEESVTLDLLPLIMVMAKEGRLEEEMFLTTFLWEEAKHVDFFANGFLAQVSQQVGDLTRYHTPAYRQLFYQELPQALHVLHHDTSPAAQARASVTYNMIVEGVLAETGYEAYFMALDRANIMPGVRQGIQYLKRDESRHIAYGVFLLSRLIAEDAEIWDVVEHRMNELFPLAIDIIGEIFAAYPSMPFGLTLDEFAGIAVQNFSRRMQRIAKARTQTLAQIYASAEES